MGEITRRAALTGMGVAIGTVAAGCGSDEETSTGAPPGGENTSPPSTNDTPAPPTNSTPTDPPKTDPVLGPKELLAGVEHIVVLMMENRSFDHFLGALKTDSGYAAKATVDGLAGTESNPAPGGGSAVTGFPATFAIDGKQYVAVSTGTSLATGGVSRLAPELRPSNSNQLFVFALP